MYWRVLFITFGLLLLQVEHGRSESLNWQIKPAYSTHGDVPNSFVIIDDHNTERTMYAESHAILIMESKYENSVWSSVVEPANENERRLSRALEERGFKVDIWRNLKSAELKTVLNDVFSNYGKAIQRAVLLTGMQAECLSQEA